jgi:hypothetical protein
MSALTNLFLGLQQNMRQSKQEQLQGLALMSKMPGAELTPAPDAEAAPWWQALMGVPAFRNGPGGMPVASVAGAPVTVKQYGRAENQAALTEMLTGLGGTSTAPSDLAPAGGIVETDNLAGAGSAAAPLTPTNVQARTARFGATAQAFGVTPDEFAGDYEVQRLLRTPGRQDEAFGKRYREMVKEKRDRLSDEQKLTAAMPDAMTKSMELTARMLGPVKDEAGYQRVIAMLRGRIDPALFAELPATYDPVRVSEIAQRGLTYAQSTETERALDRERRLGPMKTAEDVRREQLLGPVKSTEELVQFEAKERLKQQYERKGMEGSKQQFAVEDKLRDEFTTLTKTYREVTDAYGRIVESSKRNTAAGNISLTYAFMKMNDPTSVVREGEYATAQNAGGVPERIRAQYNKALSGAFLDPVVVQDFVQQAQTLYDQHTRDYTKTRTQYRDLATRNQANPDNVTLDYTSTAQKPTALPMTPQEIDLNLAETNKQLAAQGKPLKTRQDIIDGLRKLGYQVP